MAVILRQLLIRRTIPSKRCRRKVWHATAGYTFVGWTNDRFSTDDPDDGEIFQPEGCCRTLYPGFADVLRSLAPKDCGWYGNLRRSAWMRHARCETINGNILTSCRKRKESRECSRFWVKSEYVCFDDRLWYGKCPEHLREYCLHSENENLKKQ